MHSSVPLALTFLATALIVVLSIPAHAQDNASVPMGLTYRSAFETAPESTTDADDEDDGNTQKLQAVTPADRTSAAGAAPVPVRAPPEQRSTAKSPVRSAPDASAASSLPFDSAFGGYARYEEVGDPDWVAANDDAAAAGGWQAYATELFRANKTRAEASKALDAGAPQGGGDGKNR